MKIRTNRLGTPRSRPPTNDSNSTAFFKRVAKQDKCLKELHNQLYPYTSKGTTYMCCIKSDTLL